MEITDQVAALVQRERLEASLRESSSRQQVGDLERLHALGTRLVRQGDLQAVLREVMVSACELLHADKATVQIHETGRLKMIGSLGFPEDFLEKFRIIEADGITTCAAALRAREPVVVPDLHSDSRFVELTDRALSQNLRGAISVPLLDEDGAVTAIFTLYFTQPWEPSAHLLRMLDLYAQQAAVQIKRAGNGKDAA